MKNILKINKTTTATTSASPLLWRRFRGGLFLVILLGLSSCLNDLNREPFIEVTSVSIFKDAANYPAILAKIYAGLALSGQQGPSGKPDISGIDEGFSSYLRQLWKAQELPTDEAVIGWNDGSLPDYHTMTWSSNNEFITAMYNRIFYQVALANEFIRETTDTKLTERGVASALANDIKAYRAEARFLRALSYWHAIDMFGSVAFVTDADKVGSFLPKQTTREELFTYIESELKAIEADLKPARQNDYARADQGAAWMLLAKLYLNAEVYIGQKKYTECLTYCNKIIAAGYELNPEYRTLFLADNNTSKEIIFPVAFDGTRTKTWGGMTFLCHAPIGGTMKPADFGVNGGWAGLRSTKALANQFPDLTGTIDSRSMFHTDGQNPEISNIFEFKEGLPVTKYKNITTDGKQGSDGKGEFPDTDYPMFRLGDVYLMYAEAVVRGGSGGDVATAANYVNKLRQRAYKGNGGDIAAAALNLDFLLNERARELYWEGHRRTDLIRFGKFTTDEYLWPFKGGKKDGQGVPAHLVLYPIPASDLSANPNLKQNKGY